MDSEVFREIIKAFIKSQILNISVLYSENVCTVTGHWHIVSNISIAGHWPVTLSNNCPELGE